MLLERLARWCVRRRGVVVLAWAAALAGAGVLTATAGAPFTDDFRVSGVESQRAHDLLADRFPDLAGTDARIVWKAEAGVRDPAVQARMTALLDQLGRLDHVTRVQSPYDPATPSISPDGRIAFATVQFDAPDDALGEEVPAAVERLVREAGGDGVQVAAGGDLLSSFTLEGSPTEAVGLMAAIVILLLTFGSAVAMALPIVTAMFSLGVAILSLTVLARWLDIPQFGPALASMIGLGAGIDYALFVVTRYRQGLHDGLDPEDAAARSLATAGRAVLFAGAMVVVSLLGMLLVGIDFVRGMAVSAALAVCLTLAGALTLLPAFLGFIGRRIDRLRLPLKSSGPADPRTSVWYRWSRVVQRRPVVALLAGGLTLVVMTLPLWSLRMGVADQGSDPPGSVTRQAYDLLAEGFGVGFNGPLVVVAEVPPGSEPALDALRTGLAGTEGVALVAPAQPNEDGSVVLLPIFPTSAPQDVETEDLVHRLRDEAIPAATAGTPLRVHVGGQTAFEVDAADRMGDRLPGFVAAVLAVSFVLLMVVFRSLLLPLKAVAMNLLSIGAAYGAVVAVFQWGWGASLVGLERTGPIEPFFPMFLFAILFGLSMDYEVFILTRIHEEYVRTGDNAGAVADGLATTARVITAAAAIMVSIFGAAMLGDLRVLKLFGLGLAVAILVDATLVRLVVVPAAMELMGRANWWLPAWLDRLIPHVQVEAPAELAPAEPQIP